MNNNNEQFLFREPFVLLTILCLSSLTQTPMENIPMGYFNTSMHNQELKLWICHIVIPVPVIILVVILSNILGRRFAFKVLCALTITSSFFDPFPWFTNGVRVMKSITTGCVLATTFLAISEYCTPKHRLAYLIINTVARETVGQSTSYIMGNWVPVFEVGMGLMCLGSVFTWPESPYWLVVKGRREEVKSALLWLRKEGGNARSELQYVERMPGLLPRNILLWETVLPFVAVCVSQLSYCYYYATTRAINHTMSSYVTVIQNCVVLIVLSLMVFSSYKANRDVIYVTFTSTCIVSYYLFGFWLLLYDEEYVNITRILLCFFNIFLYCGVYVILNAMFIEFVPLEYNTQISCLCAVIAKMSPLVLSYIYPTVNLESISMNTFYVMSVCLIGVIVVYKFSPVTYNKNLLEIQASSALAQHMTRQDATRETPISIELPQCERDGSW